MNQNARVEHMPDRIERGRNVRDGYQRGWGLQFDKLADRIAKEPLFGQAYQLAHGRTIVATYIFLDAWSHRTSSSSDRIGAVAQFSWLGA